VRGLAPLRWVSEIITKDQSVFVDYPDSWKYLV
jgi:hypothetical protein